MDWRQQRKCDLEKQLYQAFELLNGYEQELLWAENPQSKGKLEHQISTLRKQIDARQAELDSIEQQIRNREAEPDSISQDPEPELTEEEQDINLDIDALVQQDRLLYISANKTKQAKQALERETLDLTNNRRRKAWTLMEQMNLLAKEMQLPLRQIEQFFAGQPVEPDVLINICSNLKLEWQKMLDVDLVRVLVRVVPRVRSQRYDKIQDQCGTLRLLDVSRSIELDDLYVDVNILEEPTSYQRLEVSDLPQVYNPRTDELDRFGLGQVRQARVPGLLAVENYRKLMVLGKPGSGKSTFLQHIAIQCNQGKFQAEQVPIFIRLKTFAEDVRHTGDFSLLHYINQEFNSCGIADQSVTEIVLKYGTALILLDGLDEVSEADSGEVVRQIRKFCDDFYKNSFVITCRIAAQQYRFPGFTDVEVADFIPTQIEDFAQKWFLAVARNSEEEAKAKVTQFIQNLERPENAQIREIAVTPILLTLICLVFQVKAEFPSNRTKMYEDGIEILLRKWDEDRGIRRDEVYRNLDLEDKIKLLSQVAATTFAKNRYFFEQGEIEQYITDYLCIFIKNENGQLQKNSKAVLKSIEVQHGLLIERARGIYSFSHLTFQEYFTAKNFVVNRSSYALQNLVSHISKKRWREVFLLAVGMPNMPNYTDDLLRLMKQQIDALVAKDGKLQQFLDWVSRKSRAAGVSYKPAAVRAYYLARSRALDCDHDLARDIDYNLARDLPSIPNKADLRCFFDLARYLTRKFDSARDLVRNQALDDYDHLYHALCQTSRIIGCDLNIVRDFELQQALQQLKDQVPDPDRDREKFQQWWKANGRARTVPLISVMTEQPNILHNWRFSERQMKLLNQYYSTNKFLVECLKIASHLTPTGRQEIEDTLLLPIAEIEKRRQHS